MFKNHKKSEGKSSIFIMGSAKQMMSRDAYRLKSKSVLHFLDVFFKAHFLSPPSLPSSLRRGYEIHARLLSKVG